MSEYIIVKQIFRSSLIAICIGLTGCIHQPVISQPETEITINDDSNNDQTENDNTINSDDLMIVPQVEWALNTRWDADFPDLDYADENKVIFHGDYGLFVYDLSTSKIVTSLDLKEIGCQKIQNEGSSTMKVSHDGNTVWITPYNKDYTYIFNISEGTITTESSIRPDNYFKNIAESKEVLSSDKVKLQLCSKQSVIFDNGDIGYIDYGYGGEFKSLTYKKATESWQLFSPTDTHAEDLLKQDDSYYLTHKMRAKNSLGAFLNSYVFMYNMRDYAGICALSKGLKYDDAEQKKWMDEDIYIEFDNEIDVTDNAACFTFSISGIEDAQYLYMKRDEGGWYADGLFKSDAPSEKWWSD